MGARRGAGHFPPGRVRDLQARPTAEHQAARAEFLVGQWLHARGRGAAAERHFLRAGELAPHDFTIRRGSMPMRGLDPMGPEFRAMVADWAAQGHRYYEPLPECDRRAARTFLDELG